MKFTTHRTVILLSLMSLCGLVQSFSCSPKHDQIVKATVTDASNLPDKRSWELTEKSKLERLRQFVNDHRSGWKTPPYGKGPGMAYNADCETVTTRFWFTVHNERNPNRPTWLIGYVNQPYFDYNKMLIQEINEKEYREVLDILDVK